MHITCVRCIYTASLEQAAGGAQQAPVRSQVVCALATGSATNTYACCVVQYGCQSWKPTFREKYTRPGSNWRPSACEADVIATRPLVPMIAASGLYFSKFSLSVPVAVPGRMLWDGLLGVGHRAPGTYNWKCSAIWMRGEQSWKRTLQKIHQARIELATFSVRG